MNDIKKIIHSFSEEKNIIIGVCSAERLDYLENKRSLIDIPFVNGDLEARINPSLAMIDVKSILVAGVPYESLSQNDSGAEIDKPHKFSAGVLGTDYHIRVRNVLQELALHINNYASFKYKICVDTHPLAEREFAKKAGIGWQGKNCMLISEKFGSYFNIGLMLTTLQLQPDQEYPPEYSLCGNCKLCIEACIAKCLKPYNLDYTKCVSYLTQKKGSLTEAEKESLNGYVFGCDVCQLVCRFNKNRSIGARYANISSISKNSLGSAGWRGKKNLLRNADAST